MKACRYCEHCSFDESDTTLRFAECHAPKNMIPDQVSGLGGRWFEKRMM